MRGGKGRTFDESKRLADSLDAIANRMAWIEDEAHARRTKGIPDHCAAVLLDLEIVRKLTQSSTTGRE